MGFFSFLFGKNTNSFGKGRISVQSRQRIESDWHQIDILLRGGTPSQLRQALITADKTLDTALREIVAGDAMGERLKNAKELFEYSLYDKIWKAHKMRNSLVHEAGFEPTHSMIKQSVDTLRQGLNVLGIKL